MTVSVTDRATRDIEDIQAWIEADNPASAKKIALRISKAFDLLDAKPEIGRPAPDGRNREWSMPGLRYLIVYRARGSDITILRVFHTSRLRPKSWN